MPLRVPIGRRGQRSAVEVGLDDDGAVVLTCPAVTAGPRPAVRLSFDEAEAVAGALRDLALIVRVRHDVGLLEVA